jgi:hypothetical protein
MRVYLPIIKEDNMPYTHELYSHDIGMIMYSGYYATLSHKQYADGKTDCSDILRARTRIAKEFVQRTSGRVLVDGETTMLSLRALASAPFGAGGEKALTEQLGYDKEKAILSIGKELEISEEMMAVVAKYGSAPATAYAHAVEEITKNLNEITFNQQEEIIKDFVENSKQSGKISCSKALREKYLGLPEKRKFSLPFFPKKKDLQEKDAGLQVQLDSDAIDAQYRAASEAIAKYAEKGITGNVALRELLKSNEEYLIQGVF